MRILAALAARYISSKITDTSSLILIMLCGIGIAAIVVSKVPMMTRVDSLVPMQVTASEVLFLQQMSFVYAILQEAKSNDYKIITDGNCILVDFGNYNLVSLPIANNLVEKITSKESVLDFSILDDYVSEL